MFQTLIIASGSRGNCVFMQTERTALLLDAGISLQRILDCLDSYGIDKSKISGILVSHEHSDHIKSVGSVSRKLKIPIYINRPTLSSCSERLGNIQDRIVLFNTGTSFEIGDIYVEAFSSSHDAAECCNFVFSPLSEPKRKLGVATDLGYPTQLSILKLSNVSTLILESNHDERMLMEGPYQWKLKQRIRGSQGHLSNVQAVGLISALVHPGLKNLILAHLSEINNLPSLAEKTMRDYLESIRSDIKLFVAEQNRPTPIIEI
ncbi:MAG: MBL fold metallo-hydrolase [Candidatus Cloacimonas sp.]